MPLNPNGPMTGLILENIPVKAATAINEGELAMINTAAGANAGEAEPAAPAANRRCPGWFAETQAAGAVNRTTISREKRIFANSAANPVTPDLIGTAIWVEDSLTVKGVAGANPVTVICDCILADGRVVVRFA